ncbi:MAG: OprD family outer membrane porin, partial [Saprospiraceae bacterium]|nr:OprD family outer membrane porin [Saprospiraceae bacterium]
MKIKLLLFVILFITLHCSLSAQHQEIGEKPKIYKRQQRANLPDSLSIVYAFHKGTLQGNFRYYFMSTDNRSPLTDYYANAFGGGIKYETAPFKGFQFGLSGIYIFNLLSSNLSKKDSLSNASNRYEIGLFDIENPDNKNNLAHLEEFYLKYNFKKNTIYLGKHLINTPFINLQDGRMRPTVVGGLWLELNLIKNTKIEMGWFNTIIPRSTTKWVSLENSVGLYSMGVNEDGTKSNYKNNLRTNGAGLIGISSNFGKNIKLQCWNIIFDNVFNASLVQLDYSKPLDKKLALIAAIQAIGEFAINNVGNS